MLLFYQYGIKKKHVGFIKKQPTFKLLLICILPIRTQRVEHMKKILLASTSTLFGQEHLEYLMEELESGTPYLGTSAGSNIAGPSMKTTNDMPIVHPSSFDTLGVVNFNLNPHYLDPDPNSQHKGETRETRIREFHIFNTTPVIGLREGNYILVSGDHKILKGEGTARIFEAGKKPYESKNIPF